MHPCLQRACILKATRGSDVVRLHTRQVGAAHHGAFLQVHPQQVQQVVLQCTSFAIPRNPKPIWGSNNTLGH